MLVWARCGFEETKGSYRTDSDQLVSCWCWRCVSDQGLVHVLAGYIAFMYHLVDLQHLWKVAGAHDGVPILWVSHDPLGCLATCPGCRAWGVQWCGLICQISSPDTRHVCPCCCCFIAFPPWVERWNVQLHSQDRVFSQDRAERCLVGPEKSGVL